MAGDVFSGTERLRDPVFEGVCVITIPIPRGEVTVSYERGDGFKLVAPSEASVQVTASQGIPVEVTSSVTRLNPSLTDDELRHLDAHGWGKRVGDTIGVWVSVDKQMFYVIRGRKALWQARCSTAAEGAGSEMSSNKTPLGWHTVSAKVGHGAPWGQVFRDKRPTGEVWKPGVATDEDLVLTRILVLSGEEPGKNKGGAVDSFARNIYVHGTNAEENIGTPSSHGCIRLRNDDVIAAFDLIPEGTPLLVSEGLPEQHF